MEKLSGRESATSSFGFCCKSFRFNPSIHGPECRRARRLAISMFRGSSVSVACVSGAYS